MLAGTLAGGSGDDHLSGQDGNDVLVGGGAGSDILTGGTGTDRFIFVSLADFSAGTLNRIADFNHA